MELFFKHTEYRSCFALKIVHAASLIQAEPSIKSLVLPMFKNTVSYILAN